MPEEPSYPRQEKKGKFKSEYSMGLFDFERYHKMLCVIDGLSFQVGNGNYFCMKNLYAALQTLYANWHPIIFESNEAKEINKLFEELQVDIAKSERLLSQQNNFINKQIVPKFIVKTANKLLELHKRIMVLKQWIGLGIQVKKEMSKRKMIKVGMRGVNGELPSTDSES